MVARGVPAPDVLARGGRQRAQHAYRGRVAERRRALPDAAPGWALGALGAGRQRGRAGGLRRPWRAGGAARGGRCARQAPALPAPRAGPDTGQHGLLPPGRVRARPETGCWCSTPHNSPHWATDARGHRRRRAGRAKPAARATNQGCRGASGSTGGRTGPGAVRQARPDAVPLAPRRCPLLRVGGAPGRAAGGTVARVQPAPAAVLGRGRTDRGGQRGGVRGDRARRARRAGRSAPGP